MTSTIKEYLRIGDNLKRLRENLGENQTEFAKRLGISRSTYSNYENNNRVPDDKTLQKIADALGSSINNLLGTGSIRNDFEKDFDIKIFDEEVVKYIVRIKNGLSKLYPNAEITNAVIIQNMIIDRIAEENSRRVLKINNSKLLEEFAISDGKILTGKQLYELLFNKYEQKHIKEKLDMLTAGFGEISEYNEDADGLENLRKFYDDIPKYMIKKYILEKLYPEYLKVEEEKNAKIEEMDKLNNVSDSEIIGYYDDLETK